MSELAVAHLRQAVRLSAEGNHLKAVELLEKARILVRDNESLRVQVLQCLAGEYTALGRAEQAARCRAQLQTASTGIKSPPPPRPAQHAETFTNPPARQAAIPYLPGPAARPTSGIHPVMVWGGVAIAALFLMGLVLAGLVYFHKTLQFTGDLSSNVRTVSQPAAATSGQGRVPSQVSLTPAATRPATQVASVVNAPDPTVAVVKPPPSLFRPPVPPVASPVKVDRQELLKETVGLCVVVVRYEGPVGENNFRVELPVGTGTAFCVNSTGVMLTNRHVVDAAREAKLPDTLDDDHLPFVTLREVSYVVCFGPDPKDRYVAKVLHKSEKFDMAVLKIDRPCPRPLAFAARTIRQGDDVLVCGYPGAVMEALNQSSNTPDRITAMTKKWQSTRHVEPFDEFSPDSFYSTLTRGIISAPDRHVDGVSYIQIDAAISPGNSGGPALDPDNEVLGIATWQLRPPADGPTGANYNFVLGIAQVVNELKPYLKD